MRSQTLGLLVVLAGCAGDDPKPPTDTTDTAAMGLQIAGTWIDAFGGTHTIDETSWTQDYGYGAPWVFHVAAYDNDQAWLVAENDVANGYNASLWSRFDWAWSGEVLYYCQSAFDAPDQQSARDAPSPDVSDLDVAGCGGFPWTTLSPSP